MTFPAIVVMLISILSLWGVAALTMVYSMRQEERKLELLQQQEGFEPFSAKAQRDMERWLIRFPNGEQAEEMRGLLEEQRRSLVTNRRRFYTWAAGSGVRGTQQ
ncbi:hypothetical protein [Halomonas sp. DN3]|uniref:hypothetical protein n=1 Tax=Halomonas sp. DN3 TaxID=2953657 RepID=UPI0020A09B6B|nr:hypothetical protein [Halomonas sp. DN3]USZ51193.1 hypothetical protein NKF27_06760 [Halomonas sp. DN3]